MKRIIFMIERIVPLAAFLFCMASCSSDDSEIGAVGVEDVSEVVSPAIVENFNALFSGAKDVTWDATTGYAIASFTLDVEASRCKAWFDFADNECKMDMKGSDYDNLPDAVKAAFENSEYATWTLDRDIDHIKRYVKGSVSEIYVLTATDVIDGYASKVSLYYDGDGVLLKSVVTTIYKQEEEEENDYTELLPQTPDGFISTFVASNYPQAKYIGIYREGRNTVVKLLDGRLVRKVVFDGDNEWVCTTTEMKIDNVPESVRQALSQSEYKGMEVKKITEIVTPEGTAYIFLLKDKATGEKEIEITSDGAIESDDKGDDGNPSVVVNDINAFVADKYPGAVITKRDTDDKETELELNYNGIKISVKFSMPSQEWKQSEWKLDWKSESYIPDAVRNVVENSYSNYNVEYITFVETAEGNNWYEIGLSTNDHRNKKTILLAEDGTLIAEYKK
ncbi:MAG: PepSY-like domain-containing protein [Candidatus Cryptobacteroides sp.]